MAVGVRLAGRDDLALIVRFTRELAEYERLAHAVRLDVAELEQFLFGERPFAETLIAEIEGRPVGFALFFHNFSTFEGRPGIYLEDLYVEPEARGAGAGRALLERLAQVAMERRCARLEWSVLDWNQPSIEFYKRLGAVPMDDWTVYRLSGEALRALAKL